jgi:hypothetical protein
MLMGPLDNERSGVVLPGPKPVVVGLLSTRQRSSYLSHRRRRAAQVLRGRSQQDAARLRLACYTLGADGTGFPRHPGDLALCALSPRDHPGARRRNLCLVGTSRSRTMAA